MMFTRVVPAERAVRDAANAFKRAARQREELAGRAARERAAFLRTPVGQARAAFERGDHVFQYAHDVEVVGAAGRTGSDPSETLNAVAREGWELVGGSFVSREQGRCAAVTVGHYLFRRAAHR